MNREILNLCVYGEIEDDLARTLFNDLCRSDFKKISVRINSIGGNVWTGVAIYNHLRSLNCPISVYVDGIAASAAATVAMAGDTITVTSTSTMMIHDPQAGVYGTSEDLAAIVERLDILTDRTTRIYIARTGRTREEIRAAMRAEKYFNGQDAVDFGLATHIM